MRLIVALIALAVASVIPATVQAEDWVEYRPDGIGFRIEMPDEPKLETKKSKSGVSYQAVVGVDNSAFLVIYGEKDGMKTGDRDTLLDAVVQGQSDGKKVLDVKKDMIGGLTARRVKLRDSDNDEFEIRTVIIDNRLVQALFVGRLGDKAGRRFLDSLAVVAP
jgi:hypothetical protein